MLYTEKYFWVELNNVQVEGEGRGYRWNKISLILMTDEAGCEDRLFTLQRIKEALYTALSSLVYA